LSGARALHSLLSMSDRLPRATDPEGLLPTDHAPGARIGDYIVERRVPALGIGFHYEAIHVVLPRRVEIKVMPAGTPLALALIREACIIESLVHPGIPRVYECGILADRQRWVANELVTGMTLATLADRGEVSVVDAADLLNHVATILAHAHARGLVHGNVGPTAIVIPDQPRATPVMLVDWGTAPDLRLGTPGDPRADIRALGVVASELLGAEAPPLAFAELVRRMIDPDPAQRPTASYVAERARWLVRQVAVEIAIPEPIDATTEQHIIVSRRIASVRPPTAPS